MWGQKLLLLSYARPRGETKLRGHVTPNLSQFHKPEAADGGGLPQKLAVTWQLIACERIVVECSIRGPLVIFFPVATYFWHGRGVLVLTN